MNELMALWLEWEKPLSYEEKIAAGAMGPEDFFAHFKSTGGKLPKPN